MWKAGESGNPGGTLREKKFLAALERAVIQDDGKRLRAAAEALLTSASNGEPWAIQQLADRLDGKPTQQVDMRVTKQTRELSDDELSNIAAAGSAGTAPETAGAEKPTQLH